ncbi:pilus assembly protein TadG [Solimonas fluminis]|uniref:Pilus assembly protein TadG n=1 Tax=Solimonas fluminis TaxID=2086571 RepID=A0A2S5TIC7_9GAMM|nr:TadE/TadG family type IV pilus assembly protein [Solimonas fluminis]PPE74721.1 pilus assembly protein TadG [Solimonas fluminis]
MKTMRRPFPKAQRGASAMEFALVLPVFLLILYGLITFGAAFYTQLAVSRAAEDGARAAIQPGITNDMIKAEVINSLATSSIAPRAQNTSFTTRRDWLNTQVKPSRVTVVRNTACNGAGSTGAVSITVDFPYDNAAGTRILPSITIPAIGDIDGWMPKKLVSCATAQI